MNWTLQYRPKIVADLQLTSVREALQQFLASGKIPQVLLFAGPKGTGKTSASRIIGAVLNDPQNLEAVKVAYLGKNGKLKRLLEPQVDTAEVKKIFTGESFVVQELDAASNRGIDEVRQLRERAFIPPSQGEMSVFILDEAHMLTLPAFNALLKLLEEPPQHAVFILATTELQKIPKTVLSRCQVITFQKATKQELTDSLNKVIESEKIKVELDAVELLAELADGSFRDAIKMLELVSQSQPVTYQKVVETLKPALENDIITLIQSIINHQDQVVCQLFEQWRQSGLDQSVLLKALVEWLYQTLLQGMELHPGKPLIEPKIASFFLHEFNQPELAQSVVPLLSLELKCLELINRAKNKNTRLQLSQKTPPDEPAVDHQKSKSSNKGASNSIKKTTTPQSHSISDSINSDPIATTAPSPQALGDGAKLLENWESFISGVAVKNATIAALFRSSKPVSASRGRIVVHVYYRFHQEQLSQPKIITLIEDLLTKLSGGFISFEFILKDAPQPAELIEVHKPELAELAAEALS